jgi:glycine/D-amino acid oxidase-like deaminating enzyme
MVLTRIQDLQLSSHTVGAITGPAGAVWPYRLVTRLLARLQEEHGSAFSLQTNTPVTSISISEPTSSDSHPYLITTSRGTIRARHVVHCTNSHVGHLVPGFRGRVVPVRGQMSAQGPGSKFVLTDSSAGTRSWLFSYAQGFDYLTQLPASSGSLMMFGGGLGQTPHRGVEEAGVAADDALNLHAEIHLTGAMPAVFGKENWGTSEGVKDMWTGIMGFAADGFPWVGEVPGSLTRRPLTADAGAGEWAAVGFSGEGMVHAWGSGKALAMMLLEREGKVEAAHAAEEIGLLPDQLKITDERVERVLLPERVCTAEGVTEAR